MNDNIFQVLMSKVTPRIEKQNTVTSDVTPPYVRLIGTFRFLATGMNYEDLNFSTRVYPQTLERVANTECKLFD